MNSPRDQRSRYNLFSKCRCANYKNKHNGNQQIVARKRIAQIYRVDILRYVFEKHTRPVKLTVFSCSYDFKLWIPRVHCAPMYQGSRIKNGYFTIKNIFRYKYTFSVCSHRTSSLYYEKAISHKPSWIESNVRYMRAYVPPDSRGSGRLYANASVTRKFQFQ